MRGCNTAWMILEIHPAIITLFSIGVVRLKNTRALFQYLIRCLIVKFSKSLEAVRFVFRIVQSLWHLTDTSAAVLQRWLSNFKMQQFKIPISRLWDFKRSCDQTSYRILKRDPASFVIDGFCRSNYLLWNRRLIIYGLELILACRDTITLHYCLSPCNQWHIYQRH